MMSYFNLHFALQSKRKQAALEQTPGPRVLLIGSESSGKTSLAKILTSYATRNEEHPTVVNLDPKQVRSWVDH